MSHKRINALQYQDGIPQQVADALTREEALQIRINGRPYTITMRTPGHDRILTAGLLFSEGIISGPDDVTDIQESPARKDDSNAWVDVGVREELLLFKPGIFNRSIASTASCGVCGKVEIDDIVTPTKRIMTDKKLRIKDIPQMLDSMRKLQMTFECTGGSHAAALLTVEGSVLAVQEDVGRHNAVDKVIGELLITHRLKDADILLISGRVSYEIVAKCAQAQIPFLLAVSAPSSLAVEFCQTAGITLVSFCRAHRATVYTHTQNIYNAGN